MSTLSGIFPIEKSSYYQHWLLENEAISVHRWYLSEKAKTDIGLDYSTWHWIMGGHRAKWIKETRPSGLF